jgi:protein-tyrosine phosphatase
MSRHQQSDGTTSDTPAASVLFVCLGNICRSPLAKAIFTHQARARGIAEQYRIDSCGTGHWHVGGPADPRSIAIAAAHGVELPHVARQVDPESDFDAFTHLIAMDQKNMADLLDLGAPRSRVRLMRSFDPTLAGVEAHRLDVPDPYSGSAEGFRHVYEMLWRACEGLHESLRRDPRRGE